MVDNIPYNVSSGADGLFKRLNVTRSLRQWNYSVEVINKDISWDNHQGNNPRTGCKNRARCVYRSGKVN